MTRADLPVATRAVQAAHAAVEYTRAHDPPEILVIVEADDEDDLVSLLHRAASRSLIAIPFREPDLGDVITAVALEPAAASLVRRYPLAFREGVKP